MQSPVLLTLLLVAPSAPALQRFNNEVEKGPLRASALRHDDQCSTMVTHVLIRWPVMNVSIWRCRG